MAFFVCFLCEHHREVTFHVLERRNTTGSGRKPLSKKKKENKRRKDGQTTRKLYIAADISY